MSKPATPEPQLLYPEANPADPRPFGAQRTRPRGPLIFWSLLYVAFLVFLFVMVWKYPHIR